MDMGVSGVAWGTVLSNAINALIVTVILIREKSDVHLDLSTMRFNIAEISKVCRIGLPAGLQTTVFSISNIFILSAINSFGASASAGSAGALTYEIYCYFVMTAFTQTATAFVGRELWRGQYRAYTQGVAPEPAYVLRIFCGAEYRSVVLPRYLHAALYRQCRGARIWM